MHVPANKVVHVHLRSQDVIHSFFVPQFRMKQDAVPGREIVQWFEATKPGKYELPCAELCGFGHSGMKGWIYVHGAEEYRKWAAENLTAGASPAAGDKKADGPKQDAAVAATTGGQSQAMSAPTATAHAHTAHEHHELGFVRTYIFSTDHKMIAQAVPVHGVDHDDPGRPAGPHGPLAARVAGDGRARPRRDPQGDRRRPGAVAPTTWRSPCTPRS